MHTPVRSLLAVATVISIPAQLAACGPSPAPMEPVSRLSHRQPIVEQAEDPVRPDEVQVREATAPRAPWVGVAASRGASGVLAAWTRSRIAVSRDDGKHYHYVLDGKGDVAAAAMDDAGTLFAVRGAELGVVKRNGDHAWRAIPFAKKTSAFVAGDGAIAWIGERADAEGASLAISRDDGASWVTQATAPSLADFADARVATWPLEAPANWGVGDEGWSYEVGDCGDGASGRLCAIDPEGSPSPVATTRGTSFKTMRAVTNGHATWATLDGRLAWLSRGNVMFPAGAPPKGFELEAIDADGAPIGIANGHAVRWSRDGRWRSVFGR
jgi:hypothetical protein